MTYAIHDNEDGRLLRSGFATREDADDCNRVNYSQGVFSHVRETAVTCRTVWSGDPETFSTLRRKPMQTLPTIETILASPSVSFWLKDALRSAMDRDCCDAAADARLLADLLAARRDAILSQHTCGNTTSIASQQRAALMVDFPVNLDEPTESPTIDYPRL